MPVTRSQKGGESRRLPAEVLTARQSPVEGESSGTAETASSSGTKGTMTTATGTTDSTTLEAQPGSSKERTTTREAGKSDARPTSRSASLAAEKARRRREVELRVEINRQALKEAQAAADLARAEMELLKLNEEDAAESDSAEEEPEGRTEGVKKWVETTVSRMSGGRHQGEEGTSAEGRPGEVLGKECIIKPQDPTATVVKPEDTSPTGMEASGAGALAEAIMKAITSAPRPGTTQQLAYMYELLVFDGSCGE